MLKKAYVIHCMYMSSEEVIKYDQDTFVNVNVYNYIFLVSASVIL